MLAGAPPPVGWADRNPRDGLKQLGSTGSSFVDIWGVFLVSQIAWFTYEPGFGSDQQPVSTQNRPPNMTDTPPAPVGEASHVMSTC